MRGEGAMVWSCLKKNENEEEEEYEGKRVSGSR